MRTNSVLQGQLNSKMGVGMNKSLFRASRFFFQSTQTGQNTGWYYDARENIVHGPFRSRTEAELHLQDFVHQCQTKGKDGGRKQSTPIAAATPERNIATLSRLRHQVETLISAIRPQ